MFGNAIERVIVSVSFLLIFCGSIMFFAQRGGRSRYSLRDQFIEDEAEANNARKRAIDENLFYEPDINTLPFRETENSILTRKQRRVRDCAAKKMLRLPKKMTNLELKHQYGLANLELIASYEDNFHRYMAALVEWADTLMQIGGENEKRDGVFILELMVELGSDFSKTYRHLADYYAECGNYSGLDHLYERVAVLFTDNGIKNQLLQYITDKSA